MLERPTLLFSKRYKSPACGWNQIRLTTATSLRKSPISPYAKLGLSLASFLGLITVGCSWYQLNLDIAQESPAVPDDSRESRRHDTSVYVRHPSTDVQKSQQTVFLGDHTGIARYDTAQVDSTSLRDRVTDFAVGVLPLPFGYWSVFALLSADGPGHVDRGSVSWMRENIIPAIAGSLADVHNSTLPPPDTDVDDALRQTLARLDMDVRTGAPWARQASPTSSLLAFFDSESRVLRVAGAGGAGRAFLGRRVGNGHECRELAGSGAAQYVLDHDAQSRARDVEELVGGSEFPPSRGSLDAASVEVESVEVRDGDFLVLGSHSIWSSLAGDEAVQAVGGWIREQEEKPTAPGRPVRGGRWPHDPFFDFPWKDNNHGLGLDWPVVSYGLPISNTVQRAARMTKTVIVIPLSALAVPLLTPGNNGSVMVLVFTNGQKVYKGGV